MDEPRWDPDRPIYRQVRDALAGQMLAGTLQDGAALPSIRQTAARFQLSPLTVLKAYQQLVDEQLVEKQRGRGMFVRAGGCEALRRAERSRFLVSDWPRIRHTIERLGFSAAELLEIPGTSAATHPLQDLQRR
jgi:GntR family transcriptional regulator